VLLPSSCCHQQQTAPTETKKLLIIMTKAEEVLIDHRSPIVVPDESRNDVEDAVSAYSTEISTRSPATAHAHWELGICYVTILQ
jgi:hypothetical protein